MRRSMTQFLQISRIANELFDQRTGVELERIRDHVGAAYNEAQLCALVVVGMVLRIFKLVPDPPEGTRSLGFFMGLLIQFLQNLDYHGSRALNPLDEMVADGVRLAK